MRKMKSLNPNFSVEIDSVDEQGWYQILREFDDASIFQTWACGVVACGRRNMSHLVVRRNGEVVAAAQAKIVKVPLLNVGVAYIQWGPMWQPRESSKDVEIFRQVLRALRNEYVCKRGLVLRLFPHLFDHDNPSIAQALAEEGFSLPGRDRRRRTILMDLKPDLKALQEGMRQHWKRQLKVALRKGLVVEKGTSEYFFESFLGIYGEMVSRKGFSPGADVEEFRRMQPLLPEDFKMKVLLCRSNGDVCAGLIGSAIGNSAIYLFGATSNAGMKSNGSYLLQWTLIEELKQQGISVYNLNGINPETNPGTYRFKQELSGDNGKDVYNLGQFDSHAGMLGHSCVEFGDKLRSTRRALSDFIETARSSKLWFKTAH